ncbi:immune inhibitor A, partial [Streptomyces sp. T-3]|nr:immune inhibitor A [Streptomyces sp. T-3]
ASDLLHLEASGDDGATWQALPFVTAHAGDDPVEHPAGSVTGYAGRVWHRLTADLGAWRGSRVRLRWRYATDQLYVGRGAYVDGLRVEDGSGVVFDEARPADAARIEAAGWAASAD